MKERQVARTPRRRREDVADGEAAVHACREAVAAGILFDVLIMDLTVPGAMGGQEAMRQIRTFDADTRALVSSGYSNDPVMARPAEFGFDGVMPKPWGLGELAAAVAGRGRSRSG